MSGVVTVDVSLFSDTSSRKNIALTCILSLLAAGLLVGIILIARSNNKMYSRIDFNSDSDTEDNHTSMVHADQRTDDDNDMSSLSASEEDASQSIPR